MNLATHQQAIDYMTHYDINVDSGNLPDSMNYWIVNECELSAEIFILTNDNNNITNY